MKAVSFTVVFIIPKKGQEQGWRLKMVNCRYCKEVEIHTSKRGYNYYYCTAVHRNIRNSNMPDRDCPYANKVIRKSSKK